MVWLAPSWLLLLPLVILPWLIYKLGSKRRIAIPFSAFPWLQAVHKQHARWQRWRRLFILLSRMALILLLLFALAEPSWSPPQQANQLQVTEQRYLLIIDTSPSMQYQWRGKSLLTWGKQLALDFLAKQGSTTPIVAVSSKGQLLAEGKAFDRSALRRAIEQLGVALGEDDMVGAIAQGLRQEHEGEVFTHIVIVSDLAAHAWPEGVPKALAERYTFVWLDSAVGRQGMTALPSVGIEQVGVRLGIGRSEERLLDVRIANFGEQALTDLVIRCTLNGEVVAHGTVAVGAKARMDKQFQLSLPHVGLHILEVALEPQAGQDGLHSDNQLTSPLWYDASVRVLLLNGAPSTVYTQDELFFVERALSAGSGADARFDLHVQTAQDCPNQLAGLQGYDVVLLANVASLLPLQRAALEQFSKQGGGLVVAMGDRVDIPWMNQHMAFSLPHLLRDRQLSTEQGGIGIGEVPLGELIWQNLDEPFVTGLQASRTKRYVHVESDGSGAYRTLLRLADGAPLLLQGVGSSSREKLLLWTTSLDVDDSDIALRPSFVPLMQRMIRYAAGKPQQWRQTIGQIGGVVRLHLARQAHGVAFCEADQACKQATLLEQGRMAEVGPLQHAGLVRIVVEDSQGKQDAPELAFATQPSLRESDFAPIALQQGSRQGGDSIASRIDGSMETSGAALCLLLICGLLLAETALLVR